MYRILLTKRAKKFLGSLPVPERKRVAAAIAKLPEGEDVKKLKGHKDLMRLRVGGCRVLYRVDKGELLVLVVDAGSRGEIYKRY